MPEISIGLPVQHQTKWNLGKRVTNPTVAKTAEDPKQLLAEIATRSSRTAKRHCVAAGYQSRQIDVLRACRWQLVYLKESSFVCECLRVLHGSLQPHHELAHGSLHFKLLSRQASDHVLKLREVGLALALFSLGV